ncbi:MAG: T9SS type A sorting domain-containing protein, partial [Saprospiraceae bacterium]|nr:T9SS type A sorting domain-containing protein [Saprospiraceae bacterium]
LDTTEVYTTHVKPVLPEGDFTKSDDPLILRPTLAGMELLVATAFNQPYQVDVWVTDMSGRVVDFVEFPVDAGNFYGLYPTDSLEHGVYFFTMRVKDKVKNLRFVKLTH